jgi:hypothetical protein
MRCCNARSGQRCKFWAPRVVSVPRVGRNCRFAAVSPDKSDTKAAAGAQNFCSSQDRLARNRIARTKQLRPEPNRKDRKRTLARAAQNRDGSCLVKVHLKLKGVVQAPAKAVGLLGHALAFTRAFEYGRAKHSSGMDLPYDPAMHS